MVRTHLSYYFEQAGKRNTSETLRLARERADELGITQVVVATTSGETAVLAAKAFKGLGLVAVTHSTGFKESDHQELTAENRKALARAKVPVLTTTHAFGGVGRAVRKKLATYELDEIIAYTLRTFGQGLKVGIEISLMAADAGLIRTDRLALAIGGTDRGADTAIVITPTHTQTLFDLKVHEIICKPW